METSRRRFGDDYREDRSNLYFNKYRSRIMGGEVYTVKGFDNRKKDSTGTEVIVGINGRAPLFRINVEECMFDVKFEKS